MIRLQSTLASPLTWIGSKALHGHQMPMTNKTSYTIKLNCQEINFRKWKRFLFQFVVVAIISRVSLFLFLQMMIANIFRYDISLKAIEFKTQLNYDEIIFCFESLQINRRQLNFNRTKSGSLFTNLIPETEKTNSGEGQRQRGREIERKWGKCEKNRSSRLTYPFLRVRHACRYLCLTSTQLTVKFVWSWSQSTTNKKVQQPPPSPFIPFFP